MEYTITMDSVQDFVKYLCNSDKKIYGNYEDYDVGDMDFVSMKWLIDGLYNKFLLSGSYSINSGSPIVHSYNHISKMLDNVITNHLETKNQEFTLTILKLVSNKLST